MEVAQQMLHVERLDLLLAQHLHVFDQELFAGNA